MARTRLIWTAVTQCIVFNHEPTEFYDDTLRGTPIFSPDSSRLAYGALRGGRWFVVLDGIEQASYDRLGGLAFSPDSRHLAYCARQGSRSFLMLDGECVYQCECGLATPSFSPDSSRITCDAVDDSGMYVIIDGEASQPYPALLGNTFSFSPDSREFVYGVHFGETEALVRNNVEDKHYRGVLGKPIFSHDSKHLLYAANLGTSQVMVLDHRPCRPFDYIVVGNVDTGDNHAFSPNSQRFAYVAKQGKSQYVVVDEDVGCEFDGIRGHSIIFSPDSERIACIGRDGRTWYMMLDQDVLRQFPNASFVSFLPNSENVVFTCRNDERQSVFVGSTQILECDGVVAPNLRNPWMIFDSTDAFHFLALIGGAVFTIDART